MNKSQDKFELRDIVALAECFIGSVILIIYNVVPKATLFWMTNPIPRICYMAIVLHIFWYAWTTDIDQGGGYTATFFTSRRFYRWDNEEHF